MALRVGLTGGIGSGKTIVSKIFHVLGVPVYYSDTAAKRIMNENAMLRTQITALFGDASYVGGTLNRSYIASVVFGSKEKLDALNALVHPVTIRESERWMQMQTAPYAIKEAALIFESGADAALDYVIGVTAPEPLRLSRVMQRDQISLDQVRRRMSNQLEENEKMKRCNVVIVNDEQEAVIPQVLRVHAELLRMAEELGGTRQED